MIQSSRPVTLSIGSPLQLLVGAPSVARHMKQGEQATDPRHLCGGRAGKAELLTGIEGVSSRPVRKVTLRDSG